MAIKEINAQASARAFAFGEDCIYPDGRKSFSAIETDFYVDLPVADLTNFETFGNWIAETMSVVNSLPPDMLEGQQPGFVEYRFVKNTSETLVMRVPITEYKDTAPGLTGVELFRGFYK